MLPPCVYLWYRSGWNVQSQKSTLGVLEVFFHFCLMCRSISREKFRNRPFKESSYCMNSYRTCLFMYNDSNRVVLMSPCKLTSAWTPTGPERFCWKLKETTVKPLKWFYTEAKKQYVHFIPLSPFSILHHTHTCAISLFEASLKSRKLDCISKGEQ